MAIFPPSAQAHARRPSACRGPAAPAARVGRPRTAGPLDDAKGPQLLHALGNALFETLWPTRCALCDAPETLLCDRCRAALSYIDPWRACPRCGAPFGLVQCTECNPVALERFDRSEPPFEACACAVVLDDAGRRIARLYKDAGERRLGAIMASIMADCAPPAWLSEDVALAWVPASRAARRRRGFDHAEELARHLAKALPGTRGGRIEALPLLDRPEARDQRGLSKAERIANVAGRFRVANGMPAPARVLLVDDVYTTGSTLFAASDALRDAGAKTVRCLTFARAL